MIWVFVAVAAAVVAAVAGYTVTRVSARLANTEAVATYDLSAATESVYSGLPAEVAARLGSDTVALLLAWNLDHLRRKGVAAFGEADSMASGFARTPSLSEPDEALDELLRSAAADGVAVEALDAVIVLELNAQYLASIGAVGEQADEV
ncbi:MAG: hypothetical protein OXG47_02600 [bacterium]|nr:hypothetical protein [bacterium]MCY3924628.1 hypothetical protein [bacterium]